MEYKQFLNHNLIAPNSSIMREMDSTVGYMRQYPELSLYIGIFYRVDMDTMSCDDFTRIFPLKKAWTLSVEELEAGCTLIYP